MNYIKQLEDENNALKLRLEEADMKAECYDIIMKNIIHKSEKANKGFIIHSEVETDLSGNRAAKLHLRVVMDVIDSSEASLKIFNDFIKYDTTLRKRNTI